MKLSNYKNPEDRRRYLEKELRTNLSNLRTPDSQDEDVIKRNCENFIGFLQVPLGVAGPLKVNGKSYFLPLATTEGVLVASVNRGCKAISSSGGARAFAKYSGITRGPIFRTKSLQESFEFENWINKNLGKFKEETLKISKHLKLIDLSSQVVGMDVFARFNFDSGHAMGMNMATSATSKICDLIFQKTGVKCISISGNYCIDKKASWLNFIKGRGYQIWAETEISENAIKKILKTDSERLIDVWMSKCMMGSALAGSLGFNAQYANIIAALFISTGQDPAHVVEGSLGITSVKKSKTGLNISVFLPDVPLGILGGGTELPTQRTALSILSVKNPLNFAKVLGGAVLAGEISLLASLAEGTLSEVHEKSRNS